MVFKRLLKGLRGNVSVETVLDSPDTVPGGVVNGVVQLAGTGEEPAEIEEIVLGFVTRVEVESGDSEWSSDVEFGRNRVGGSATIASGERRDLRFALSVPWETPLSAIGGHRLHRPTIGVRTDVAIAKALDKGDLDPVVVHALPVQDRILEAMIQLGFRFKGSDVERGRVPGSALPFYQEFEFYPAPQFARGINELELTFVASPHDVRVLLEADRRGGFFMEGYDAHGGFAVEHASTNQIDWRAVISDQVSQLGARRGLFF
jgi:sporulation-control protein